MITTKASDLVVKYIFDAISKNDFADSDKLPSAESLAKLTGTSIVSAREAIQSLSNIGLLKISHGRGIFLTGAPHLLIEELLETRKVIESACARRAAEHMGDEEKKRISELVAMMDEDASRMDAESFGQKDYEFHMLIGTASGNRILRKVLENIRGLLRYQVISINRLPGNMAIAAKDHRDLFNAIEGGRPEEAYSIMIRPEMSKS
jgi:GntR family transcriptional repressor for pyruvate dehydrogenase complex